MTNLKLMDLARMVGEMAVGDTIDFSNSDIDAVAWYGKWCGIKRIDVFENDNRQFLIGEYGGEANTRFYQISEYDPQIGMFCEERINRVVNGKWIGNTEHGYIECIARMIADFCGYFYGSVNNIMCVDEEV